MMRNGAQIRGRADAHTTVDALLDGARAGRSGALVVRGEAGIGKSALLAGARAAASDMHVLALTGVDAEHELPYAGLHLLLGATDLDTLPAAQGSALGAALGRGGTPDRFLVGLAVLTALADLAAERPVLVLLDDAHWIDRASADALLFATRRLDAEGVAVLAAARTGHAPPFPAPGLPELVLPRLDEDAARAVLAEAAPDLPRSVQEQLVREAAGVPLALWELPAAHRAGRAPVFPLGPPDAGRGGVAPTGNPVEHEFAARIAELPAAARTLLVVAAADGTCDSGVVLAAAERLGAGPSDVETVERAGLLVFSSGCLGFPHPLIRTAAYGSATLVARQAAHRALAEVLDGRPDPDRATWHRAASGFGPDEGVAVALEASAQRAITRGGQAAAAAAYERAAALGAPGGRGGRLVAAAEAAADAGDAGWAATLAAAALDHPVDAANRAVLATVRARLAEERARPDESLRILLDAAAEVRAEHPFLAVEMLLWAIEAAWAAGDAQAVRRAKALAVELPGSSHVTALAALAATGLAPAPGADLPAAVAALQELRACTDRGVPRATANIAAWLLRLGDDENAGQFSDAAERVARAGGALGALPRVLALAAVVRWHRGQAQEAAAALDEGTRIARDIGQPVATGELAAVRAQLAAIAGDELGTAAALAAAPGAGAGARSLLDLGAGRFDAAADRLAAHLDRPDFRESLPDLVEAAVRSGRDALARKAATAFDCWAGQIGQQWAAGVALRCAALVSPDPGLLYEQAVAHHGPTRPFELARTRLLYGEWLRRERRRSAARAPLRAAAEAFEELGALPWAERARAELRAAGESRVEPVAAETLTPQELQVVRLAAEGLSNRDIGAQLFLSPRTVGYHLYKAFPKLGVTSRAQLTRVDLPA